MTDIVSRESPLGVDYVSIQTALKRVPPKEIPASADIFSAGGLRGHLDALGEPPPSAIVVGDIMLGGRARKFIKKHGPDYPFEAVLPILRRASIVLGNLEGPFTRKARKHSTRSYAYRVEPRLASSLTRAGINVVTLANNHLLDCGREGVVETLEALSSAGVAALGAAVNKKKAHAPVILEAGKWRIGLLGYYWNKRCAATATRPGGAMDSPKALEEDIGSLRERVDRVVVVFHWGIPYEHEPLPQDRAKARLAVEYGADAVVGHHPHVIQPFEVYRGRPIFYSVGNFAFGSGNSRAEGLGVELRFEEKRTIANLYPLYVKNRDPRVAYQPKVLTGKAAERKLRLLADTSGPNGPLLRVEKGRGTLDLPWQATK